MQPVSIRPQQTQPGSFITIKEVQGVRYRWGNLLAEYSLYFDTKHHHYQYFCAVAEVFTALRGSNNETDSSSNEQDYPSFCYRPINCILCSKENSGKYFNISLKQSIVIMLLNLIPQI